jgi:hypothetical protein
MKVRISVFAMLCFGLTCIASADDYEGLAGKGYRWVTVNGPYACTTEQEVQQSLGTMVEASKPRMRPPARGCARANLDGGIGGTLPSRRANRQLLRSTLRMLLKNKP